MALVVDVVLFTIVEAGVVAALDAAVELASRAPLNGRVLEQLGGGWVGEEALTIAFAGEPFEFCGGVFGGQRLHIL